MPLVTKDNVQVAPESLLSLPWVIDKDSSYVDYRCWVEILLDAGMALHKPLPQNNPTVDTLATAYFQDPDFDEATPANGVNLGSSSNAVDVIQRMASSTYRFVLRGFGLRAGYQVPIPGLKSVGDVPAVPAEIQRGANVIVGNHSGIPLWFAFWELHYMITRPPRQSPQSKPGLVTVPIPSNPALHINPKAKLPSSVRLPWTTSDQVNAEPLLAHLVLPLARLV